LNVILRPQVLYLIQADEVRLKACDERARNIVMVAELDLAMAKGCRRIWMFRIKFELIVESPMSRLDPPKDVPSQGKIVVEGQRSVRGGAIRGEYRWWSWLESFLQVKEEMIDF
jgi:hypothetical protein